MVASSSSSSGNVRWFSGKGGAIASMNNRLNQFGWPPISEQEEEEKQGKQGDKRSTRQEKLGSQKVFKIPFPCPRNCYMGESRD